MNTKKILGEAFLAFCILGNAPVNAENSITEYEQNLDIYDFNKKFDWQEIFATSKKLRAIDDLNAVAFRAEIYYYREQNDFKTAIERCNQILAIKNCPPDIAIEANTQLGDIYYRYFKNSENLATKFTNPGIELVKKNYSKAKIEELVNGTNFQAKIMQPAGKTNTVRELYILKSNIEKFNPTLKTQTVLKNLMVLDDTIYDIKYKTDW